LIVHSGNAKNTLYPLYLYALGLVPEVPCTPQSPPEGGSGGGDEGA